MPAMHLSPLAPISPSTPASIAPTGGAVPMPPARWSRFWTSPIAKVEYGAGSLVDAWREAFIPSDRGLTGDRRPKVTFAGSNKDAAIAAAHALAATAVELPITLADGSTRTVRLHPAIAVLRDAHEGVYWLAPLRTTVRSGDDWIDAPHTIDGAAFEGESPILRTPTILSATRDMVAVVGRDSVIVPERWTSAPDDSRIDA
jgi:hypothetical protein